MIVVLRLSAVVLALFDIPKSWNAHPLDKTRYAQYKSTDRYIFRSYLDECDDTTECCKSFEARLLAKTLSHIAASPAIRTEIAKVLDPDNVVSDKAFCAYGLRTNLVKGGHHGCEFSCTSLLSEDSIERDAGEYHLGRAIYRTKVRTLSGFFMQCKPGWIPRTMPPVDRMMEDGTVRQFQPGRCIRPTIESILPRPTVPEIIVIDEDEEPVAGPSRFTCSDAVENLDLELRLARPVNEGPELPEPRRVRPRPAVEAQDPALQPEADNVDFLQLTLRSWVHQEPGQFGSVSDAGSTSEHLR